jgi:hypothetical protein
LVAHSGPCSKPNNRIMAEAWSVPVNMEIADRQIVCGRLVRSIRHAGASFQGRGSCIQKAV